LETKAKQLNISEIVKFHGYVPNGPDLFEIYRKSDIFILPTLSEGFPKVLDEAMGQSIPIITTNVGGIAELMKDGENALIIPTRSSSAIVKSIKRMISDSQLRRTLIANGWHLASAIVKLNLAEEITNLIKEYLLGKKTQVSSLHEAGPVG